MGMWGARLRGRAASTEQSSALPADRLSQLMTFVERAAVSAPVNVVPPMPPRIVPSPRPLATIETTVAAVEPVPATPVPAPAPVSAAVTDPAIAFPEPITVEPAPVVGKRRRVLPQSA